MKQKIIFPFSLLTLIISLYRVTKPGNKENEQMTSFSILRSGEFVQTKRMVLIK